MTDISADGESLPELKPHVWRHRDYLRAYVGENWQDYVGVFDAMKKKPGLAASWSWTIFFIPSVWMAYRRRYSWAIGMVVLGEVLNSLPVGMMTSICTLAVYVLLGFLGKALYVRSALADIDRALARTKDQHSRVELVKTKGGISDRALFIVICFFFLPYLAALFFLASQRL
jgi:hypothetical protein